MHSSVEYRVTQWTTQGKRYASLCGRYENGSAKWCWVPDKRTTTRLNGADAAEIVEFERTCGRTGTKMEKAA